MKSYLDKFLLIIIFGLIIYNIVPLFLEDYIIEIVEDIKVISLMAINPLYCLISNYLYAKNHGFDPYLPIILGLCFFSTILLFFDNSFLIYIVIYIVISFIGEFLGLAAFAYFQKLIRRK